MSRGRILAVSYGPPRPDRDSGSRRLFHLIELLREAGWETVFLTANAHSPEEARYIRELQQRDVRVYDGTTASVEWLLSTHGFDFALLAFWQVAELFVPVIRRVSPSTRVIVDSVDLQFVRNARRLAGLAGSAGPVPLLDAEYGDQLQGELNVYVAADAVLAVSAEEAGFVDSLFGTQGLAFWVPDTEEIELSPLPFAERSGLLYLASFLHPPNLDGFEYLCDEILPRVDRGLLERHPLSVVGSGLDDSVRAIARGRPYTRLVGWVPSVEPYLASACVVVAPLRFGAGTKRKVIQALMAGTPVVASTVGAEGLGVRDGKEVLVADDAKTFASAIERLLQDETLWRRLSAAGRRHIEVTQSRAVARERFIAAIEATAAREPKPPLLPPVDRDHFNRRLRYLTNVELAPALRALVRETVPPHATVLVVSEGSSELLRLGKCAAVRFPRQEPGQPTPPHPADSRQAIDLLESEVRGGADFLLLPDTSSWWLRHYPGLKEHLDERYEGRHSAAGALYDLRRGRLELREGARGLLERDELPARLVALYLPQFHPIPENDRWWGEGFTEWSNVAKAQPLFADHYQPHVPADLGFYDLRASETREAQARLAAEAGISAFCYYHYWFGGKQLLERPFDEVLHSGRPDFQFCLCWANEPWSRRWDGRNEDVLQPQTYSEEDDLEHIRWLLPALRDPRALTVDGKPVFLVYQAKELPDPARTTDLWRREVREAELPGLYLIAVETGWDAGWDATQVGFDAKVLFQPQFSILSSLPQLECDAPEGLRVWDYQQVWRSLASPDPVAYRRYETVCTGWDNSARAGRRGWVLDGSTPEAYGEWLRLAIARARERPPEHRLVFLNAWNEWAEGAHLEPDLRSGRAYLEETRRSLESFLRPPSRRAKPTAEAPPAPPRIEIAEAPPTDSADSDGADGAATAGPRARAIAFYLPQFHPIPENDEWWGPGFTEWTNVVRAKPLFPGHHQPHLPAKLGYYDLRVPEVRAAQAALARGHGIEAFCYYHYWFHGRRLLERPFDEVLATGQPDFPFCLCWANESWSRRWLGEERDILIKQEYSARDDLDHARWLAAAFADPRYLLVQGRPLFLVYRPNDLPDPLRLTKTVRREATRAGLPEPFLLGVNSWQDTDYRQLGFDGSLDYEPWLGALDEPMGDGLKVYDYTEARARMRRFRAFPTFPSVVASWDNTPRRGADAIILADSTPEAFERALAEVVESTLGKPFEDRLVFLNAWNEWAEGNHLEPDQRHGLGYLEAVLRVILADGTKVPVDRTSRQTSTVSRRAALGHL